MDRIQARRDGELLMTIKTHRVRDRLTRERTAFDSRPEAEAHRDLLSTSEITGEPLRRLENRLVVERNTERTAPMLSVQETAAELLKCASAWEPEARLLGSLRACEIVALASSIVSGGR